VGKRNIVSAVLQGSPDPVAAFTHGSIGQADGVEVIFLGLDAGDVHFNLNDAGIDAIHRCAQSLIEHEVECVRLVLVFKATTMKAGDDYTLGDHHTDLV